MNKRKRENEHLLSACHGTGASSCNPPKEGRCCYPHLEDEETQKLSNINTPFLHRLPPVLDCHAHQVSTVLSVWPQEEMAWVWACATTCQPCDFKQTTISGAPF